MGTLALDFSALQPAMKRKVCKFSEAIADQFLGYICKFLEDKRPISWLHL